MADEKIETITIETLIEALVLRERWSNAHADLRGYANLRAALLLQLFGVDFDERARAISVEARAARRAAGMTLPLRPEDADPSPFQGEIMRDLIRETVSQAARTRQLSPFFAYHGAFPPRFERALHARYAPQLDDHERALAAIFGAIIRETLELMFPGISARSFPADALDALGLPRQAPDERAYE